MWRVGGIGIVAAMLALFLWGSAEPIGRTPEARAAALSSELMSPYCPGMTLATCPSAAAGDLRREIVSRLDDGENESEITGALIERFGDTLQATPPPEGAGLALRIVPALVGMGMLVLLLAGAGLMRRNTRERERLPAAIDTTLSSRLDDELQQLS